VNSGMPVSDTGSSGRVPLPPPPPPRVPETPPKGCGFYLGWILAALFFVTSVLLVIALFASLSEEIPGVEAAPGNFVERVVEGTGESKILLIEVCGLITDEPQESGFITIPGIVTLVRGQLKQARDDDRIKALILSVDSPGGGITASDIIHNEIMRYKTEKKVKVVALMGDVAASGGYYISLPADKIIAHPTTITGSIGVIAYQFNVQGLMEKIGLTANAVKSGPKKDMGSPFREMTPEEQAIFQKMIDELHSRFVKLVAEGRKMPRDKVKALADGRIFTAKQALEKGLIDEIGYFNDAVKRAKELAKLKEAKVIRYARRAGLLELLLSKAEPPFALRLDMRQMLIPQPPKLMYLWTGRRISNH